MSANLSKACPSSLGYKSHQNLALRAKPGIKDGHYSTVSLNPP